MKLISALCLLLTACTHRLPTPAPDPIASNESLTSGGGSFQAINEGCNQQGSLLSCSLLPGTHAYAIASGAQMVYLPNYTGRVLAVTKVRTITLLASWAEMSVYKDWIGLCEAPGPEWCAGNSLPGNYCPCQRDTDGGPALRLVGQVGNLFEAPSRHIPDLTWGAEGFSVEPWSFIAIGDNKHGSTGTMFEVTVEDRAGADLVLRQPKIDKVWRGNGSWQTTGFEPWQADSDMTLLSAQIYAVGGQKAPDTPTRVKWACINVFDDGDWSKPAWGVCSDALATTGNARVDREVRKGQWIAGQASHKAIGWWDYVVSITAKRH